MPGRGILELVEDLVQVVTMATNKRTLSGDRLRNKRLVVLAIRGSLPWRLLTPEQHRGIDLIQTHSTPLAMVAQSTSHAKLRVEGDNRYTAAFAGVLTSMMMEEPLVEIRQYLRQDKLRSDMQDT